MDRNKKAIELLQQNKIEDTAQLFAEIIEENPKDPLGYINFGNLLLQMEDFERAKNFFKKAIELDDKAGTAYFSLGNLYYEQSHYKKAQENFNQAIELGLEDSDAYYMLGMSFLNQEHIALATPYLLRATELNPDDVGKLFQYGLVLAQSNYINDAMDIFKQVLKKDSKHSDAHYNLGVAYTYQSNLDKGLYHLGQALKIQPEHVLAANTKEKIDKLLNDKAT